MRRSRGSYGVVRAPSGGVGGGLPREEESRCTEGKCNISVQTRRSGCTAVSCAAAGRRFFLSFLLALAVRSGEGWVVATAAAGRGRSDGGLGFSSMLSVGRRGGSVLEARLLRWRANNSLLGLGSTSPMACRDHHVGWAVTPLDKQSSVMGQRRWRPIPIPTTTTITTCSSSRSHGGSGVPTVTPFMAATATASSPPPPLPKRTPSVSAAKTVVKKTSGAAATKTNSRKKSSVAAANKKKAKPAAGAAVGRGKSVSRVTTEKPGGAEGSRNVLVIVESPAKARTITALLKKVGGGELYKGYTVDACKGHVTELVSKRKDVPQNLKQQTKHWDVVGVDVENGFEPMYIQNAKTARVVNRLKKASAKCDEIILATDEDREGEAISWHLLQVLQPTIPVKRAVFHEITQDALIRAFEEPRGIDINLVQAQEARRVLDRLAGFTLTPVIWNLIAPGMSAGRVQSVALAMVVERERARLKFKSADYWDVVADVAAGGESGRSFEARLVKVGSKVVVSGKDFDPDTGEIKEALDASKLQLLGSEEAAAVAGSLSSLGVLRVDKRRVRRQPPAPFITSTLQQESSRKLRLGASQTMMAAQALYEAGYITYMRTDRPSLSKEAAGVAERAVRDTFGDEYTRKGEAGVAKVKGSQEAHEAIRPALIGGSGYGSVAASVGKGSGKGEGEGEGEGEGRTDPGDGKGRTATTTTTTTTATEGGEGTESGSVGGEFLHPSDLAQDGLEEHQRALYDLIYRRTLASAMAESEADFTTVSLGADGVSLGGGGGEEEVDVVFKATGKTTVFEGFLKAYREGNEEAISVGATEDDKEMELPAMAEGSKVAVAAARPALHRTSPPRRYSEASFIKELEAQGVGRPSTYATIIQTLRTRTYVNLQGRSLTPSLTGFVVADLLIEHFPEFTDTGFTAEMEDKLDAIARGDKSRVEYLTEYYLGEQGLKARVARKREMIDPVEAKRARLPGLECLDGRCSILVGPYGGYLIPEAASGEASGVGVGDRSGLGGGGVGERGEHEHEQEEEGEEGKKSSGVTLPYVAQDNLELLTVDLVERCLDSMYKGGDVLGQHPDTGEDVRIRMGRYGPFLECGERKAPAFAHISNANRKDPTDLSMPSQPTPSELLQRQQHQQHGRGHQLSSSPAGASAVGEGADKTLGTSSPEAVEVDDHDDILAISAEDVIAFGLGATGSNSSGYTNVSDGHGGGDAGSGAWYSAVSLERAVGLLSLPRVVCEEHPTEGGSIEVGIGRFGPWVKHNDSYKNVPGGVDVLDVDRVLAVQLVDEMIARNKERPTVEIGALDGEKVLLKYGKYGRCISCGGTLVTLPSRYRKTKSNPEPEEISVDEAIELVLEKRAKESPASARARGKKAGRKSSTASSGTGNTQGKTKGSRKKTTIGRSSGENKRPLSGFFRFCKESREAHAAAPPAAGEAAGAAGTALTMEVLSGRWKALTEEKRAEYNAAASAALDQWKADKKKSKAGGGGGGGGGSSGGDGASGVVASKAPKAPKNAYILFCSERRPVLKREIGDVVVPLSEMTKKLAHEWRELEGSSVREEYERRAALLKHEWLKEKQGSTAAVQVEAAPVWVGGGVGRQGRKELASAAINSTPAGV